MEESFTGRPDHLYSREVAFEAGSEGEGGRARGSMSRRSSFRRRRGSVGSRLGSGKTRESPRLAGAGPIEQIVEKFGRDPARAASSCVSRITYTQETIHAFYHRERMVIFLCRFRVSCPLGGGGNCSVFPRGSREHSCGL